MEYAHGGTDPIATLNDANETPVDCSVDSNSGNLAAANGCVDGPDAAGRRFRWERLPRNRETRHLHVVPHTNYQVIYALRTVTTVRSRNLGYLRR